MSSVFASPGTPVMRPWPPQKICAGHAADHRPLADDHPRQLGDEQVRAGAELAQAFGIDRWVGDGGMHRFSGYKRSGTGFGAKKSRR